MEVMVSGDLLFGARNFLPPTSQQAPSCSVAGIGSQAGSQVSDLSPDLKQVGWDLPSLNIYGCERGAT